MFGLPLINFENSIKSSAENELVFQLTVFVSCNVVSPDNIYTNKKFKKLITALF